MEKNYGQVLRRLREEKGYSLRQISNGILSTSFLSKFERGESNISLSHFIHVIERMNISLDEFVFSANEYKPSELDQLMSDIATAYQRNNTSKLKNIMNKEHQKWEEYGLDAYLCNSIMAEAKMLNLQKKEIDKKKREYLANYLFNIELWGNYELVIYANSLTIFPPETVIALSKEVVKKTSMYKLVNKNFVQTLAILINTIIVCLETNLLNDALYFILTLENMHMAEKLFYERTLVVFLKGIYEIKKGNKEIGEEISRKAVAIMYTIGSEDLAISHEEYLESILAPQTKETLI
ncbi:helix-turn-helix domain-containing protein [Desemzia sp. RIT804]|uniref:helix-turn-helix domain-containing protein n=1 Tax=Desemzia sp. RIT 804 TaxID=2810209 RepID=UPI00194F99B0|nr:Rgg/GadR/MutR family transcriptional regulator [Desemzia sp. RIT 804]MBM6615527.1 helix-turn-helix domain-containing protein [Desemzia sp. RIT 804]